MARCDEGYLCHICGEEVKRIDESTLYLQYVLGWLAVEQLRQHPEAHLACSPSLSQFILDDSFPEVQADADWHKSRLDPVFREQREQQVTAAYQRLKNLQKHRRDYKILEYPLIVNRQD